MSARRIAELIPAEYRKEIIQLNMIDSAHAIAGDPSMHYLAVIWKNYVEHDFTPDCNLCLSRVLDNFKAMKATFVEMAKENSLLNEA